MGSLFAARFGLQCTQCVSFFRGHGSLSTNPGVPPCWAMPMERWHQGRRSQVLGGQNINRLGSLMFPCVPFLSLAVGAIFF